ncbi:hypothetical protein F5B20DRAFT_560305 [Whalleya microplaca]|nr:hypothetical protein F5B20DRAFT_560305 [Whalleya microplaca]
MPFFLSFLFLASVASTQGYYRRRAGHAAALAGNVLLVDGGLVCYDSGVPLYENQTWIIDLSSSWTNTSLQPIPVPGPASRQPFETATLWYDSTRDIVYEFGGVLSQDGSMPGKYEGTPEESMWCFEMDESLSSGIWTQVLGPQADRTFPSDISRPILGASAAGNSSAYYIGGLLSKWTTNKAANSTLHSVPGLLQFDFNTQTLTNSTNDGSYFASQFSEPGQTPSIAGMMIHVPLFGSQGVFVIIGGQSNDTGQPKQWWNNATIFDPSSGSWYYQRTGGDIPQTPNQTVKNWAVYCAFGAQDNELMTFDIFTCGRFTGFETADTCYILSLPSFTWFATHVKSYPRRVQQTCTATGNRQMIMIGGLDPDQYSTDPQNWQASTDPWGQGIGVFDMTELKYTDKYDSDAGQYASPYLVQIYYQKNNRFPTWDDPRLQTIFESTHINQSATPGGGNSRRLSTGSIVGIVVSVVGSLALLVGTVFFRSKWKAWNAGNSRTSCNIGLTQLSRVPSEPPPTYSDINEQDNFSSNQPVTPSHAEIFTPPEKSQQAFESARGQNDIVDGISSPVGGRIAFQQPGTGTNRTFACQLDSATPTEMMDRGLDLGDFWGPLSPNQTGVTNS